MQVTMRISGAGMDGTAIKPLVLRAVQTAQVMAQALYDQFHKGTEKVTFSVKGRRYISQAYMEALSGRFRDRESWARIGKNLSNGRGLYLQADGNSAWSWKNSAIFHSIARKDDASYDRTGGMWNGMHVRNFGAAGAIIEFRGQSLGQTGVEKKARGRVREGEKRKSGISLKVPNRLKAWTVFEEHGVLVVAPDREVQRSLEDAVGAVAENWSRLVIGGKVEQYQDVARGGMGALTTEFVKAMRGG